MARIGIIGAGFTGLGTAYYLDGHDVTIFEREDRVGGLAAGITSPQWKWPVDKVIHHWFTSDTYALTIAREIGMGKKLIIRPTKSSCFAHGKVARLDTPMSVLLFPFVSMISRLRLAFAMAVLKLRKEYKPLERETAYSYIRRTMGDEAFNAIWKPLFVGKFGKHAPTVSAAWFWARIHSRTSSLAYIEGGFQTFADALVKVIVKRGGKLLLDTPIESIRKTDGSFVVTARGKEHQFDYLVLAVPLAIALKLYPFPKSYVQRYQPLRSIGAQYFMLELSHTFLEDGTYWLNINEPGFPFMMVAEHTNFIDRRNYGGKHIVWVGKYLDYDDELWLLGEKELLELIIPYLQRINPRFKKSWISRTFFSRFPNAQPIMPVNYSRKIPPIETPVENLYLATMHHVYPWDRGTSNALGLGHDVAQIIRKTIDSSSSKA